MCVWIDREDSIRSLSLSLSLTGFVVVATVEAEEEEEEEAVPVEDNWTRWPCGAFSLIRQ